ncbi:MAG: LON peptidase substrate-binding domain-containing protein [Pseudomonadota bacterium]
MFDPETIPNRLPIFPLPGALLLPRGILPLNIFEPRYLAMIDDVLKTDHRMIGMIQPRHPSPKQIDDLRAVGCMGRITNFTETPDGRYQIGLNGIMRFRVAEVTPEGFHPYLIADVDRAEFENDLQKPDIDEGFIRQDFLKLLKRYFKAKQLQSDWENLAEADEALMIDALAMLCPFENEEKQLMLEAPNLEARREMIQALMEFAIRDTEEGEGKVQ